MALSLGARKRPHQTKEDMYEAYHCINVSTWPSKPNPCRLPGARLAMKISHRYCAPE